MGRMADTGPAFGGAEGGDRRALQAHSMFASFQGEGLYVGAYQLFLRLRGCNLACRYCDTPEAREEMGDFLVLRGEMDGTRIGNPVPVALLAEMVTRSWEPTMHSLALTGGEPLLQAGALRALLSRLKESGIPVYLETNGTLPGALAGLLDLVEYVAMDVKLPSAVGGRDLLPLHANFLSAARGKRIFLKMVLEETTPLGEVEDACEALGGKAPEVPLVIQPASPFGDGRPPSFPELLSAHRIASRFFHQVRVIPQVHHLAGWS